MSGESRHELLAWVNNLLQLNITKVEQMGTGAALCQIYDSIFQDVPMSRVKFNVSSDYAYINNFKVLQNTFTKHQIERTIPVEALTKCKMQDNLEFLQWTKRFWDSYFPGGEYDAIARRKASGAPVTNAPMTAPRTTSAARRGVTPTGGGGFSGAKKPGVGGGIGGGAASGALAKENASLKETVVGLERERDFYFSKLRDIELLMQDAVEKDPELEKDEKGMVRLIQDILYSTEEGFEIPQEQEEGAEGEVAGEELETF